MAMNPGYADRLLSALEEILFEDIGLEGAAGLAGDDKQSLWNIDQMLERLHLGGIGGVKHVQGGIVRDPAEGQAQNFGTKT
jgi:hypothetical protein